MTDMECLWFLLTPEERKQAGAETLLDLEQIEADEFYAAEVERQKDMAPA